MLYIIGYGEMAKAIASGLDGVIKFSVVGRDENKLRDFSNRFNCDYFLLDEFNLDNKNILLAVKPYALELLSLKGTANILISILAGKSINEISKYIQAKHYVRAMPNIGAKNLASITAIYSDDFSKDFVMSVFNSLGEVVFVNNEEDINRATAIIGSGPAFLAIIAEAISDAGVYNGLNRELSEKFTRGLFKSFISLEDDFSRIKNSVSSPAGTTIEGVFALENNGIRAGIMKAIIETYEKSKKL